MKKMVSWVRKNLSAAFCFMSYPVASCASVISGFLANRVKKHALPQCRKLLGLSPALPEMPKRSALDLLRELTGIDLSRCPSCKLGTMIVVGELTRQASSLRWDSS